MYYLSLEQIQEKSPCKKCSIFTKCRQEYGGVCWREVIKAYGNENWDYPDPRCPKAESVTKKIYIWCIDGLLKECQFFFNMIVKTVESFVFKQ